MSLTSYARTDGAGVLPGTYQAVQAILRSTGAVPDWQRLDPAERLDYWAVSDVQRAAFDALAARDLLEPPSFLPFALAPLMPNQEPPSCPSEAPLAAGFAPDGYLSEQDIQSASARMGVAPEAIRAQLPKFHGRVQLVMLPRGARLYRTVGLTARATGFGAVCNKLLGDYWEPGPPTVHGDVATWRAMTAVLPQWNGDFGYLEVELAVDVWVLQGVVALQSLGGSGDRVLPGGGQQIYAPHLTAAMLTQDPATAPLRRLLKPSFTAELASSGGAGTFTP